MRGIVVSFIFFFSFRGISLPFLLQNTVFHRYEAFPSAQEEHLLISNKEELVYEELILEDSFEWR